MNLKEFQDIIKNPYQDEKSEIIFQINGEFYTDVKLFKDKESGSIICNIQKEKK